MKMSSLLVELNGTAVWAYTINQDGASKVRLGIDDWEHLNLFRGQRISVRFPSTTEQHLYVATVTETPPVVWLTLVSRMKAVAV
jgi:hypothetical protein